MVKCDSFFNFFNTVEQEEEDDKDDDDDDSQKEDSPNEQLHQDMELGSCIRDDLVPLALEFYLGVVPQDSDDSDEDFDDVDSDEDNEKPKKKEKKKEKKDDGPTEKKQEECKQQ